MTVKQISKWAGRVLMIAAIAFILNKIYGYRTELLPLLSGKVVFITVLCSFAYGGIVYLLPFIYRKLLLMTTGRHISYTKVGLVFCRSNLYKYLPGNVMQYVGRNQLAVEEKLSHADVAAATLLEIIVTLASSSVIIICFSFRYALMWLQTQAISLRLVGTAIIAGCLLMAVLLIVMRRKLLGLLQKYVRLISARNALTLLALIFYNVFTSLLNSALFLIVLITVGVELPIEYWLAAVGLFSFSFLLGYVTPGVPGGIGIREAVLTYFFGFMIDSSLILAGALLFRLVSIVGDLIGYVIALTVSAAVNRQ